MTAPSDPAEPTNPVPASAGPAPLPPGETALIEEACKKSGLIWVTVPRARDRAAWHVWHEREDGGGAAYVVVGGGEQEIPGLADGITVRVTVRSKDKGGRLVTWPGRVTRLEPGGAEWAEVVPALHAKRLNAHDGEAQPERWAARSAIFRIEPHGALFEGPGRYGKGSGATRLADCAATTR